MQMSKLVCLRQLCCVMFLKTLQMQIILQALAHCPLQDLSHGQFLIALSVYQAYLPDSTPAAQCIQCCHRIVPT